MHLRTTADLDATVRSWIPALPDGIEVVAGVPRSGLLVATLLGLYLNRPVATVEGLLEGRVEGHGMTRGTGLDGPDDAPVLGRRRRVLVVDDTIDTGSSLRHARERITAAGLSHDVVYGVVYGRPDHDHPEADLVAERVPVPRVMGWNLLHHPVQLQHMAVALEGVLLPRPPRSSDLTEHLARATPLVVPTGEVGTVVTALPDATHDEVAAWLDRHGICWRALRVERPRRSSVPLSAAYRGTDAALLVVGPDDHAAAVARTVHRPVVATSTMQLHEGGAVAAALSGGSPLARWLRRLLGERGMQRLRSLRARWRRLRA